MNRSFPPVHLSAAATRLLVETISGFAQAGLPHAKVLIGRNENGRPILTIENIKKGGLLVAHEMPLERAESLGSAYLVQVARALTDG